MAGPQVLGSGHGAPGPTVGCGVQAVRSLSTDYSTLRHTPTTTSAIRSS